MSHKLNRQILGLIETTPFTAPRSIDRHGLKTVADEIVDKLNLGKCDHAQVVGILLRLIERGKVVVYDGKLEVKTSEHSAAQGKRRASRQKRHARGNLVGPRITRYLEPAAA